MKRISIFLILFLFLLLSGCSVQEQMNTRIFIMRLEENYPELTLSGNEIYRENEKTFCFLTDSKNNRYALQFDADSKDNIKKICLVSTKNNKTDDFKFVSEAIISTYTTDDAELIAANLFKDEWSYYNSQWHRYTSTAVGDNLFFSVENIKLSTNTDAELTLKPNDLITP